MNQSILLRAAMDTLDRVSKGTCERIVGVRVLELTSKTRRYIRPINPNSAEKTGAGSFRGFIEEHSNASPST